MTSVQITELRLNGLRFQTAKEQQKQGLKGTVHVYGVLDEILAKSGVENMTADALDAALQGLRKKGSA